MSVELTIYSQENITEDKIYNSIYSNAQHLLNFLNKENILDKINEVNKPGASSAKIQEVLLEEALKIGFNSEKKGLFSHYKTSALRPDYYSYPQECRHIFRDSRRIVFRAWR